MLFPRGERIKSCLVTIVLVVTGLGSSLPSSPREITRREPFASIQRIASLGAQHREAIVGRPLSLSLPHLGSPQPHTSVGAGNRGWALAAEGGRSFARPASDNRYRSESVARPHPRGPPPVHTSHP